MRRLIIFVPDIEHLVGGSAALPSGLQQRLVRARRIEAGVEGALAEALGLGPLPSAAALSRLALGPIPLQSIHSTWLRFDPIGLVPDLTSVWVERPVPLDFSRAELQPLVAELGAMFAAEGLTWQVAPGQGFGLLELEAPPAAEFLPLAQAQGRRLDEVLPSGTDARCWHRLINESQMLFHQFRALDRADQRSLGLWFWGTGRVSQAPSSRLAVCDDSGEACMAGLARWLGVALDSIEAAAETDRDTDLLLYWPLSGPDPAAALQRLESRWLNQLRVPVELVGNRGRWQLTPGDRYAFWRRGPVRGFVEDSE
ncbi:MAG: hypothetical protein GW900_03295 [Gammaproteobacteria bacterium]|nr:hypothetical protein [Gammaproteobacteria bacterium]